MVRDDPVCERIAWAAKDGISVDPSLAIVGLLISVLASAYAEFVLIGSGASAVASLDDRFEARNVALMLMPAICGYLIGPPLIGILGDGFR